MPLTAHLLYGPPGCGKTTFARKLERESRCVRFSHDEWMAKLYGANPPADRFAEFYDRVYDLIWDQALRVLSVQCDVILDFGFWTRASRDIARRRIRDAGAEPRLYTFDCDLGKMRQRVLARTAALPADCLYIDGCTFDILVRRVEPLGPDEPFVLIHQQT